MGRHVAKSSLFQEFQQYRRRTNRKEWKKKKNRKKSSIKKTNQKEFEGAGPAGISKNYVIWLLNRLNRIYSS